MAYVQTGKKLYSDSPYTYTRCQEKVNNNQWPVAIGGFAALGLGVHGNDWDDIVIFGVGGSRKFH